MTRDTGVPMIELEQAYDRLTGALGTPRGITRTGWCWAMARATEGWTIAELRAAVKLTAAQSEYFPRPGAVGKRRPPRELAPPVEGTTTDRCRSCHVAWHYAGYETGTGIVLPRLRCGCPPVGEGWRTPAALAWVEQDETLIAAGFVAPLGGTP